MSSSSGKLDDPGMMEVIGKVLIATIIALFLVIVLVFLFHIYARWLWYRRQQHIDGTSNNNHVRHHHSAGVTVLRRGLDASFLKTLPISQFDSIDFKDGGLECSVCLFEVQQGENTRILPKCNHAFHAECIDMWFYSHSTCPICRTLVSDQQQTEVSVESLLLHNQQEHQSTNNTSNGGDSFPTNVLFWGDETEVSTLTSQLEELEAANHHHQHPISLLPFEQTSSSSSSSSSQTNDDRLKKPVLVIDIPRARQHVGDNNNEEDHQSIPMMRSLRRILSSSRRFYPFSPATPNNNNIAQ